MGKAQEQINDMVVAIFNVRQSAELHGAQKELGEVQTDHGKTGTLHQALTFSM